MTRALLVQTLISPFVIGGVWLLARRLFDHRVAVVAAAIAAFYPNMWQWEGRLYSEALALPLGVLILLLALERPATRKQGALVGVALGLAMLVRPTSVFMLRAGARRVLDHRRGPEGDRAPPPWRSGWPPS